MRSEDLKAVDGAAVGAWIKPRLGGNFGAVTLQVPEGFEAYARIFHPAFDQQWNPARWAQVAEACGTTPHRAMQWRAILGLRDADGVQGSHRANDGSGMKWIGSDPSVGEMDIETLDTLCGVLADHTGDGTDCFFGLCTIHGWLDHFDTDKLPPLLELPYGRNHIVLAGPLSAVDQIVDDRPTATSVQIEWSRMQDQELSGEPDPSQLPQREAPNLIWPADGSWLVASEVDFDSTLVGGNAALIDAIVKSPNLEAWHVKPTDSLADDGDEVNVVNDSLPDVGLTKESP